MGLKIKGGPGRTQPHPESTRLDFRAVIWVVDPLYAEDSFTPGELVSHMSVQKVIMTIEMDVVLGKRI